VATPDALEVEALIVTRDAHAAAFRELARLHTLTGVPTKVRTIEAICAATPAGCDDADPCHDTAKALKDALVKEAQAGLHHVVLGGDMSIVPSRRTHDVFSNVVLGVSYDETFYSDHYFADLSEWDTNGDCAYGDPATDGPDYVPELAVTRVSASSAAEIATYVAKATAYLTAYDTTRIGTALFLSNVATEITVPIVNTTVPVDSALYFETNGRTLSTIPTDFDVRKLYSSLAWPGAAELTVPAEIDALQAGANLVVHSGHGAAWDLTVEQDGSKELTGAMAYALENTQLSILLSCACEAATFADGDASAGQNFITAPKGGGVGYLGNSTIGLGIAGGMQLIDGALAYAFSTPRPLVGDAIFAGHATLPKSDEFSFTNVPLVGSLKVPVIDADSWRWTEKALTYLGDGLLPLYTEVGITAAPTFAVTVTRVGDFSTIAFAPSTTDAGVLAAELGADVWLLPLDGSGKPVFFTVAGHPDTVTYGFSSKATIAAYATATLP
jgi:hypothetical protein